VQADADIEPGATVQVRSARDGQCLALGAYSPHSQIRIRIWSFDPDARLDGDFFHRRLSAVIQLRRRLPLVRPCTALRLVNAESDGLPGLIVDQYGNYLVCQFLSAGTEKWKSTIVEQLSQLVAVNGIYERSDADVRSKEGLEPVCGVLRGQAPNGLIEIRAGDLRLLVDVHKGHKTGLYLDQRENQARVADFCPNAQVLNCFCYAGAFGLWALKGGAESVVQVDASQELLDLAERNRELNGQSAAQVAYTAGNVFEVLRRYRDSRRRFDLIVLDPPKFVAGAAQLNKGTRGYKDINLLALKLLKPGGGNNSVSKPYII
jgi:23S rRNA (cytosine1962-C5)-methyltransferase